MTTRQVEFSYPVFGMAIFSLCLTPVTLLLQICIVPSLYALKTMQERASSKAEVTALLIYGMALFFLFTTSTVYHCLSFAGAKG